MAITRPIPKKATASVNGEQIEDLLSDIAKYAKAQQFALLRQTVQQLRTAIPGTRSLNQRLLNTVVSVEEALTFNTIGPVAARRDLMAAATEHALAVRAMVQELVTPSQEDESHQGELFDVALQRAQQKMSEFATHKEEVLKQVRTRGLVTVHAPILAMTNPMLDSAKLKANGWKASSLEGYPVLQSQMVLGVSVEKLHELSRGVGMKEVRMPDGSQTVTLDKNEREELKEQIVGTFLAKHRGMIQVGKEHSFAGVSWFWFLPADHLKLMKSCTMSPTTVTSLVIRDWGFPFQA